VSARRSVKHTRTSRKRGRTDWKRVDRLTDAQIRKATDSDKDAAPILDKEWFRTAKVVMPERKVPLSMRLDREVLDWFRAQGLRYQSRMNAVLKAYVRAHGKKAAG
jgi:uncharacterized protein (DUF4415 family)